MASLYFRGTPKVTITAGRSSKGSPIDQSSLSSACYQHNHFNLALNELIIELYCPDGAEESARIIALASPGISSELSEISFEALLDSGEFR